MPSWPHQMRAVRYSSAAAAVTAPILQHRENEIGSLGDTHLGQERHLIAECRNDVAQMLVFGNRLFEAVTPFVVGDMDFRPRRRQKHAPVIAMRRAERRRHRSAA